MLTPYSDLKEGAFYVVPNETPHRLRQKNEHHTGCALREVCPGSGPAFHIELAPDTGNCLWDSSLMVMEIHMDTLWR